MKAIKLVIGSMPMLLLAACMEAEPEATLDPITRAISGKTSCFKEIPLTSPPTTKNIMSRFAATWFWTIHLTIRCIGYAPSFDRSFIPGAAPVR